MEIGEDQYMRRVKLKALQQSFNSEREKSYKGGKTINVIQKYLKLEESEIKAALNLLNLKYF